jgi:hypothetical protein
MPHIATMAVRNEWGAARIADSGPRYAQSLHKRQVHVLAGPCRVLRESSLGRGTKEEQIPWLGLGGPSRDTCWRSLTGRLLAVQASPNVYRCKGAVIRLRGTNEERMGRLDGRDRRPKTGDGDGRRHRRLVSAICPTPHLRIRAAWVQVCSLALAGCSANAHLGERGSGDAK